MTLHRIEYEYKMPEWASMEIDIDPELDYSEKESIALADIKETYSDISDIEIIKITEIN